MFILKLSNMQDIIFYNQNTTFALFRKLNFDLKNKQTRLCTVLMAFGQGWNNGQE